MISIRFQPHGPLNSEGFANAGDSALVLTFTKAEKELAERIVAALDPLYAEGRQAGLFETLEISSEG